MEKKRESLSGKAILGLVVIVFVTIFMAFFSYINEPIGDDVLCYFDGALTLYLDDFDFSLGNRISGLGQVIRELFFIYFHWSGRMTGYAFELIGKILPKCVQAFFTSGIFTLNVFLALRIVYGKSRKVLENPLIFCLLYLILYWYRNGCYYTYMWTMVSIYSFSLMLVLLYYNLYSQVMQKSTLRNRVFLQILGFFAGFSHEIFSLCLIVAVGINWIRDCLEKKNRLTSVFYHTGLGIGYLLCFCAPGNFSRTTESHDIVKNPYLIRLKNCITLHKEMLVEEPTARWFFWGTLLMACTVVIIMIIRKDGRLKTYFLETAGLMGAAFFSVAVWAAMPRCPVYGLDLWGVFVYIFLLFFAVRINDYVNVPKMAGIMGTFALALFFSLSNIKEVYSYTKTSLRRRECVRIALEENKSEIVVPKFAESLSDERYHLGYLNSQDQYDRSYYQEYYGVRLIIESE